MSGQCYQPKPVSKDSFLAVPAQEVCFALRCPQNQLPLRELFCSRLTRASCTQTALGEVWAAWSYKLLRQGFENCFICPGFLSTVRDTSSVGIVCWPLKGKARAVVKIRRALQSKILSRKHILQASYLIIAIMQTMLMRMTLAPPIYKHNKYHRFPARSFMQGYCETIRVGSRKE